MQRAFIRKLLLLFGAALFLLAHGISDAPVNAQVRSLRVVPNSTAPGAASQLEMRILLDSQGDEASVSFSLNFSPSILTNPVVTRGSDATMQSNIGINAEGLAQGRLGILFNTSAPLAAGSRNIINVRFTIPANIPVGSYLLGFGSVPTPQSVLNADGQPLLTNYLSGVLVVGTADGIGISGRVLTPDGRGLVNATVVATDANGNRRFATTSSSGTYQIPYVRLGHPYTFTVQSKRYRFTPRVIIIDTPFPSFDFVGQQ